MSSSLQKTAVQGLVAGLIGYAVVAFNGIHMLLSVMVGMAAAWLVHEAEEHHEIWYILLLFFVSLYLFGVLSFGVFGAEVLGVLTWGMAVAGNAAWLLAVLGYLLWAHRELVRTLGEEEARAAA